MKEQFTNEMQNMVLEFQDSFGQPNHSKPTLPTLERFINRKGWGALEEVIEQFHTLSDTEEDLLQAAEVLKGYIDKAVRKESKKPFLKTEEEKFVHLADGLADEMFFLLGDCVEAGIDIEPVLRIVHESNMSKLFTKEDGTKYVEYNEHGKVTKSPEFFAPEPKIKEEILRQIRG